MITYPYWDSSQSILVKVGPWGQQRQLQRTSLNDIITQESTAPHKSEDNVQLNKLDWHPGAAGHPVEYL